MGYFVKFQLWDFQEMFDHVSLQSLPFRKIDLLLTLPITVKH